MHRYLPFIKQCIIYSPNKRLMVLYNFLFKSNRKNSKSYPSECFCVCLTLGDQLPILEVFLLVFLVFQLIHHIPDKIKRTTLIWEVLETHLVIYTLSVWPGVYPCPGHIYECLSLRLSQGSGMVVLGDKLQCEPGIKIRGGSMKKNSKCLFLCI